MKPLAIQSVVPMGLEEPKVPSGRQIGSLGQLAVLACKASIVKQVFAKTEEVDCWGLETLFIQELNNSLACKGDDFASK